MGLAIVIILVAIIGWWLNFDKPLKQAAEMAKREVSIQDASHKSKAVKKFAAMNIDDKEVVKAKENKELLDSFDI